MFQTIYNALKSASRPVLIVGAGVRLSGASEEILELSKRFNLPVAPTWAGLDIFPDGPLTIPSFGTHGTRAGNFAVQTSDFIPSIGSRLDSKATGTPVSSFAPQAKIYMVDVDKYEIGKFGQRVIGVCQDAKEFINQFLTCDSLPPKYTWLQRIHEWKVKYPSVKPEYYDEQGVNPYVLINTLSEECEEGEIICTDTGCAVAWVSQAWGWKSAQRFLHAFNQTPMGYGLPAAIGAHYASGKRVVLISGDGSLMMSLSELATVKELPIKIVLLNNQGHAMCRQTQREWLDGKYYSTQPPDLKFPDFRKVAQGCGIPTWMVDESDSSNQKREVKKHTVRETIEDFLSGFGAGFMEVKIDPDHDVIPKVKYGYPNHDGHPQLSRDEFKEQCAI